MDNNQPIIIKRIKRYAAGHHGGSWKIAFADFATAMMAFFLVLWLLSSATPEQKKAISGYFQDPLGFTESASPYVIDLGGSPTPSPNKTLNPQEQPDAGESKDLKPSKDDAEALAEQVEQERLKLLLQELQKKVNENPSLQPFKDQIFFEISPDGLRVQIVDAENRPMFDLGSARLQPYFEEILLALADTIRAVPNKISISGHTDAKPYAGTGDFGNWELSANRANAARRALEAGGYPQEQIARVVGYASSVLFDTNDPFNPVNRRIDIVVLTKKALRAIETQDGGKSNVTPEALPIPQEKAPSAPQEAPTATNPPAVANPAAPSANAPTQQVPAAQSNPTPPGQPRNLFEDDGGSKLEGLSNP